MKRKIALIVTISMVMMAAFAGFATTALAEEMDWDDFRIAGADRYATAHEIAKIFNESPERVLIVRGDDENEMPQIIDGLTASGLAGVEDTPILLVRQDRLPDATKEALEEMEPEEAWIIGGTAAISEEVEAEIEALGIDTERIAGENRFETAAEIALKMESATGNIGIITNGNDQNLVDSLTAGPLALQGHPILLVNNLQGVVPPCTVNAIDELGIEELIIIGGTSAVSQAIEDELDAIESVSVLARIGGENRYETSALVAALPNFDEFDEHSLVNGFGTRFVDAVAASTLGSPILYFNGNREEIPRTVVAALREKGTFRAIGGPAATPESIIKWAFDVAGIPFVAPTVSVVFSPEPRITSENWVPESNVEVKITRGDENVLHYIPVADADGKVDLYLPGLDTDYEPMGGDHLMMTDNDELQVNYEILHISVTETDEEANTVTGTADPNQEVVVEAYGEIEEGQDFPRVTVTADNDGDWIADFTGEYNFYDGLYGGAMVFDAEGNNSIVYWDVGDPPEPTVNIYPADSNVTGWPWTGEVTVTVNDQVYTIDADGTGYFDFIMFDNQEVVLEGGDNVVVTDGITTYTVIIAELELTTVNRTTGVISGTTAPNGEVNFVISTPWKQPGGGPPTIVVSETLTADGDGVWSYDFEGPIDEDDNIVVSIQDDVYGELVQTIVQNLGVYSSQ